MPVCSICNSKWMWTQLTKGCSFILSHHMTIIEMRQSLKRIHSNQYVSSVSLNKRVRRMASVIFDRHARIEEKKLWWIRNIELTYISLISYLHFKLYKTPGSCKYANFVISSTPQGGKSASLGYTLEALTTICTRSIQRGSIQILIWIIMWGQWKKKYKFILLL